MSVFVFALMSLAAYRITRFLVTDSFPPVVAVRAWLLKRWSDPKRGNPDWADVTSCPLCAGFWVSGLVLAATRALGYIHASRLSALALWLPLAGAQALLSAIDARLM